MRQLVLVVGAGGQLGEAMAEGLQARHAVVARTRAELDVTSAAAVHAEVEAIRPDVIVNCAAWTDVDGAEDRPVEALAVNACGASMLARAAIEYDATLVHFSTDFVFDGDTTRPYAEDDAPNPRGTYAASKLLGEWFAAEAPRHYVLRVESLFGGSRAKSSVDRLLDGILAGAEVRAFRDRVVSPSFVEDVVMATDALLGQAAAFGLYHCVNSGWGTWLEVARDLAAVVGRPDAAIVPVAQADVSLKAPRPLFAALSNRKLEDAGIEMPSWQDAVRRYVRARVAS
jgi:dTDP-4-dehydrorhamnose reductase